jgi:hypothetical protein
VYGYTETLGLARFAIVKVKEYKVVSVFRIGDAEIATKAPNTRTIARDDVQLQRSPRLQLIHHPRRASRARKAM